MFCKSVHDAIIERHGPPINYQGYQHNKCIIIWSHIPYDAALIGRRATHQTTVMICSHQQIVDHEQSSNIYNSYCMRGRHQERHLSIIQLNILFEPVEPLERAGLGIGKLIRKLFLDALFRGNL